MTGLLDDAAHRHPPTGYSYPQPLPASAHPLYGDAPPPGVGRSVARLRAALAVLAARGVGVSAPDLSTAARRGLQLRGASDAGVPWPAIEPGVMVATCPLSQERRAALPTALRARMFAVECPRDRLGGHTVSCCNTLFAAIVVITRQLVAAQNFSSHKHGESLLATLLSDRSLEQPPELAPNVRHLRANAPNGLDLRQANAAVLYFPRLWQRYLGVRM